MRIIDTTGLFGVLNYIYFKLEILLIVNFFILKLKEFIINLMLYNLELTYYLLN